MSSNRFHAGFAGLVVAVAVALIAPEVVAEVCVGGEAGPSGSPAVMASSNVVVSPLTFNFTKGDGILALESGTANQQQTAANVVAGFQAAGDLWSSYFVDPITINVKIDFTSLGSGILGSTGNNTATVAWYSGGTSPLKAALIADATSSDDTTMIANLQPVTSLGLDMVTIDTGALVRDHDASTNNIELKVPRANLKALGLLAGDATAQDGSIKFSSNFNWDFNPDNGISGGKYDFVGVAAHEIGHLMGFVSGVDKVDVKDGVDLDDSRVFSVLDLCRYSANSLSEDGQPATGAVLDLAYGDTPYVSIDAGVTNLGRFATGSNNGDGRQASHWKDNLGLGIMDPTASSGEFLAITALDIQALDVIGYNIPEPGTLALLGLGALAVLRNKRTGAKIA